MSIYQILTNNNVKYKEACKTCYTSWYVSWWNEIKMNKSLKV